MTFLLTKILHPAIHAGLESPLLPTAQLYTHVLLESLNTWLELSVGSFFFMLSCGEITSNVYWRFHTTSYYRLQSLHSFDNTLRRRDL